MAHTEPELDLTPIVQTAFAFWSFKVLLTATEFDLFTTLGEGRHSRDEIQAELGLQERGIADFLDALVAMNFLDRDGEGAAAKYFNTPASALFLNRNSSRYVGGVLIMLNDRLFKFWHDL